MRSRWVPLGIFLLLAFMAAVLAAIATATSVHTWYPMLRKPGWTPPAWVFAPVWTLLYVAMSVAAWRVWRMGSADDARRIVRLFAAQLTLNALWSILFFGLRHPGLALIDVLVLWLVLVRMLVPFRMIDQVAGILWAVYFAWVTFAAVLNASIWELNR